jgi:hypothetical protein
MALDLDPAPPGAPNLLTSMLYRKGKEEWQ